jgi:hypothetical protein
MMSTIVSDVEIVKNNFGAVYWPAYYVNLIGNMLPSQGYQIKMINASTLTYASNSANLAKANIMELHPQHFYLNKNTGSNMTLGIPNSAWNEKPNPGDEIGVFSPEGIVVGSSVYDGNNLAISIWGNDKLSEEIDGMVEKSKFSIVLMTNGQEQNLQVDFWLEGDEFYKTNKISIIEKLSIVNYQLLIVELFQNAPNPFSETTTISYFVPHETKVEIVVYNVLGEKIAELENSTHTKGKHELLFDAKAYSTGTYIVKLNTSNQSISRLISKK